MEILTGGTPEIYDWINFGFYDLGWYWNKGDDKSIPNDGRWLGVAHKCGSALNYF